jgi:AcrR family transcriptional regulator
MSTQFVGAVVPVAEQVPDAETGPESAKRKQILDGARRVFLSAGFAAASMGEIARESKVSKGTLYVYFTSKEALFAALIEEARRETSERLLGLDSELAEARDGDVSGFLTMLATGLMEKFRLPNHVATVRMVMGAADRFPVLARQFYEGGAGYGHQRLTTWITEQVAAGRLVASDPDIAAWQFISMCCHPISVRVALGSLPPPDDERIRRTAGAAVATFLAAYGPR